MIGLGSKLPVVKQMAANSSIWPEFHDKLIDSYPHVATVRIGQEIATIIEIPLSEDSFSFVDNLRLTVMGVGVCARISTFCKPPSYSHEEILRRLKAGEFLEKSSNGSHIVLMRRACTKDLIKISMRLGLEFSSEEVAGLESILGQLDKWSLDYMGDRMIGVGLDPDFVKTGLFAGLVENCRSFTERYFPDGRQDFVASVKSRSLWFGDMGYPWRG